MEGNQLLQQFSNNPISAINHCDSGNNSKQRARFLYSSVIKREGERVQKASASCIRR